MMNQAQFLCLGSTLKQGGGANTGTNSEGNLIVIKGKVLQSN